MTKILFFGIFFIQIVVIIPLNATELTWGIGCPFGKASLFLDAGSDVESG